MKAGPLTLSMHCRTNVSVSFGEYRSPWRSELLSLPHPIGRLRFGDRNDSPTWLPNAEFPSYAGTVPSDSFFVWQVCSLRLMASCFQTSITRIPQSVARKQTEFFLKDVGGSLRSL